MTSTLGFLPGQRSKNHHTLPLAVLPTLVAYLLRLSKSLTESQGVGKVLMSDQMLHYVNFAT